MRVGGAAPISGLAMSRSRRPGPYPAFLGPFGAPLPRQVVARAIGARQVVRRSQLQSRICLHLRVNQPSRDVRAVSRSSLDEFGWLTNIKIIFKGLCYYI